MDGDNRSKVDELNEKLNSRTSYKDPDDSRSILKSTESPEVGENWQSPDLDEMLSHERTLPIVNPLMKRIFISAVVFFVATLAIGAYIFFGGNTFISSKNVDISVLGPTSISAGETLELGVTVSNKNNADLESANISIQYPQGSRDITSSQSLTFNKEDIGSIKAGGEAVRDIKFVLIGSTGEVKEIKFTVEYKVKGSNATFYKEKIYEITIGNTPLTLTVESPTSITSGETFNTNVTLTLNSTDILKGVMLRAEYPYGYSVANSNPNPISENNVWSLGDMSPGDKKVISIKGQLVGEDTEERTFRFYAGVSDGGSANPNFQNVVVSFQNTVSIARPSIGLSTTFNGDASSNYTAPVGQSVSTYVKVKNNMTDKLLNPKLEVKLSGQGLDKSSVSVQNSGIYNASTDKVSWNLSNNSGNSELSPGDTSQVSFSFSSLSSLGQSKTLPEIVLDITMTGIPVGGSSQNPITITDRKVIKVSSEVNFSSKMLHSIGAFFNEGPIPPKVGENTTYTAVLNVGNTRSNINNTKVTARLGQGVTWVGASSFASENIEYDEASNTITWDLGTLVSGAGFSSPMREVSFQVSFKPTTIQIGSAPVLISNISLSGVDSLTSQTVSATNPSLTTSLPNDPAFIQGDDIVVK